MPTISPSANRSLCSRSPSKKLLKRRRDDGWLFVCQLTKNRRFEGVPLARYLQQPSWHGIGLLAGEVKVLVVRYRLSRKRQEVEEVIRLLKSLLSLEACQAGFKRSSEQKEGSREGTQEHHTALCLVAYLVVERERLDQGDTWRQRKRQLILQEPQGCLPALEQVSSAA